MAQQNKKNCCKNNIQQLDTAECETSFCALEFFRRDDLL